MKHLATVVLLLGCAPQHRTAIDPGRIEERERSFSMFKWAPPTPPPERESPRWGKLDLVSVEESRTGASALPFDRKGQSPPAQSLPASAPPPTEPPRVESSPTEPLPAEPLPNGPPMQTFAPRDVERRTGLAADWSAHAGPGITGIQVFGAGARGLIAYGEGCSDAWLDANVASIWLALKQHGFIAVHCQAAVQRWTWPRSAQR